MRMFSKCFNFWWSSFLSPNSFWIMAPASWRLIDVSMRWLFPWEQLRSFKSILSDFLGKNLLIYSWIWSLSVNSSSFSFISRLYWLISSLSVQVRELYSYFSLLAISTSSQLEFNCIITWSLLWSRFGHYMFWIN